MNSLIFRHFFRFLIYFKHLFSKFTKMEQTESLLSTSNISTYWNEWLKFVSQSSYYGVVRVKFTLCMRALIHWVRPATHTYTQLDDVSLTLFSCFAFSSAIALYNLIQTHKTVTLSNWRSLRIYLIAFVELAYC